MLEHIDKSKILFLSVFCCMLLVGCQEEKVIDLPSPMYDSEMDENYVSIRDYTEENKLEYDEEVLRDVEGRIIRPSEYDVKKDVKAKFKAANHRSIVKLMHGIYFGMDDVNFKTIDNYKYLVLDFTLYNTNKKEMSLGILNDAELDLSGNINLTLDTEIHLSNPKLIDFNNYKEMVDANSERKITMYFKFRNNGDVNKKSASLDSLNTFGDIQLTNLGMSYILQDPIYVEDFNEEQKAVYKQDLANLGLSLTSE